jgi:cell wall assembly regulator SMI1
MDTNTMVAGPDRPLRLDTLLNRLEAALNHFARGLTAQLPGPASNADLRSLAESYGAPLPPSALRLLARHDGSAEWPILPGFPGWMLSAREMAEAHRQAVNFHRQRSEERARDRQMPDPDWVASNPFQDWRDHPRRLPIGITYTNDKLVIDEFPGGIGTMGQLLFADNECGIALVALSLEELLSTLLNRVEAGTAMWGEAGGGPACWRATQDLEELHASTLLPYFERYGQVIG